jgi:hypothetical protein
MLSRVVVFLVGGLVEWRGGGGDDPTGEEKTQRSKYPRDALQYMMCAFRRSRLLLLFPRSSFAPENALLPIRR